MARITLAAFGSLGDLHPHLAVGAALAARGHDVTVATHGLHRARVERTGLSYAPMRPHLDAGGEEARAVMRHAMHPTRGTDYVLRRLVLPAVGDTAHDVLAAAEGAGALVTSTLVFAGSAIAERLGIPLVNTVLQPTVLLSPHDPPTGAFPGDGLLRATRPHSMRLLLAILRPATRGAYAPLDRVRRDWGLAPDPRHPILDAAALAARSLALWSRQFAPPPPDAPPNAEWTGFPFHDEGGGARLPDDLERFLDAGEPPVVFTLGSSAVWVAGDFHHWAAEATRRLGVRAVLLVGDSPERLPKDVPAEVHVCAYAPHAPLFARACAIVHQGGIGTTAQALRAGKPMLVVPFSHDQPDNAARVARLGAGRALPLARADARTLRGGLERVLADDAMAAVAARLGDAIRAEHGAERAARAIEAVV